MIFEIFFIWEIKQLLLSENVCLFKHGLKYVRKKMHVTKREDTFSNPEVSVSPQVSHLNECEKKHGWTCYPAATLCESLCESTLWGVVYIWCSTDLVNQSRFSIKLQILILTSCLSQNSVYAVNGFSTLLDFGKWIKKDSTLTSGENKGYFKSTFPGIKTNISRLENPLMSRKHLHILLAQEGILCKGHTGDL